VLHASPISLTFHILAKVRIYGVYAYTVYACVYVYMFVCIYINIYIHI
jgi:hypothetical protein